MPGVNNVLLTKPSCFEMRTLLRWLLLEWVKLEKLKR